MKRWLCTMLAVCALGVLTAAASAAENKKPATQPKESSLAQEAMMAARMPGPDQALMKPLAGEWTYSLKMWQSPSAPPMETTGKRSAKMLLGGRYLEETFTGTFMGQPFEGIGRLAYDKMKKQWVSTWIDNQGTGILYQTGTYDGTNTWTFTGDMDDPMTGKTVQARTVTTLNDPDTMTMTMYAPGSDGKEMKTMEMTMKRVK